eukprot:GHVQ01025109.1.p2 GENE.GHVQ01025109.1~~GHVQ01025109.1.p2  ORF type:complete len:172 (-),score=11.73 GHVQ01025109.1:2570-3085(-)
MMHSQLSGDSTAQITGGEQNKIKTYILLLRLRILLVLQEQLLDSGIYQAVEFLKAQSCCPDRRWIEKYADALMSAAVVNGSGCPANEERNRTIQSGVDCPKLIALTKLANDHSNMIVVFSSGKLLRPIRRVIILTLFRAHLMNHAYACIAGSTFQRTAMTSASRVRSCPIH